MDRSDFRVHVRAAHVSLYGVVQSEFEKQFAEYIVNGLPGVVHVANELAIEQPWEPKPDDQIEADIQQKWQYAFFDNSSDLDVNVVDGVAVLSGSVDTWRQWQTAMDLAIEAGAKTPHNKIEVRFHPAHGGSDLFVPTE